MKPYLELGKRLKKHRIRINETITESAQAVNMDRTNLSKIENGFSRPSLEALNSLMSHYSISGLEAVELSKIAGYEVNITTMLDKKEVVNVEDKQILTRKPGIQIELPKSLPVLYSDSVFVTASQYGLVFDFAQNSLASNNQAVVARIGMSKEHAQALLKVLGQKLIDTKLLEKKEKN